MSGPPNSPKIYHITHVDNLPAILAEGCLVSDRTMVQRGGPSEAIGMSSIKQRRVDELEVACHPGTKVGDFVPFYFCPRSIMLYVIHCANHHELKYREGQGPIVHLVADAQRVVEWATSEGVPWCFSLSNAGANYTEFRSHLAQLNELDWSAIRATDFREPDVKEGKQAEFLLHGRFPIELVERVGVHSEPVRARAVEAWAGVHSAPPIGVQTTWYY
jgi:hypothetical protein